MALSNASIALEYFSSSINSNPNTSYATELLEFSENALSKSFCAAAISFKLM